jgi:hypothetical protein
MPVSGAIYFARYEMHNLDRLIKIRSWNYGEDLVLSINIVSPLTIEEVETKAMPFASGSSSSSSSSDEGHEKKD